MCSAWSPGCGLPRPMSDLTALQAVQLGLGAAALTKFHYKTLGMRTTAIEINPQAIAACRGWVELPPDNERLQVLQADAGRRFATRIGRGAVHALQVDLYDHEAAAPVLDSAEFYADCRATAHPEGCMTVNLFGRRSSYARSLEKICTAFGAENVWAFKPTREGNTIGAGPARGPAARCAAAASAGAGGAGGLPTASDQMVESVAPRRRKCARPKERSNTLARRSGVAMIVETARSRARTPMRRCKHVLRGTCKLHRAQLRVLPRFQGFCAHASCVFARPAPATCLAAQRDSRPPARVDRRAHRADPLGHGLRQRPARGQPPAFGRLAARPPPQRSG